MTSLLDGAALTALTDLAGNPGALRGWTYRPAGLRPGAPLVVVLHGCTQAPAGYNQAAGWSQLADEAGFALLFPEQQRANNPNLCWNWFLPGDTRRDAGEAASIRQMVAQVLAAQALDPARVFVTGLSAGGAMANALLACYPEVFAGGAILAGLPYGCASGVPEALERMRGQGLPPAPELQRRLRAAAAPAASPDAASPYAGPWPRLSLWHGEADSTVAPANLDALIGQWRGVHGLAEAPSGAARVEVATRRVWRDARGRDCLEAYSIPGMAHGAPLKTRGPDACGSPAPFMLDVGISSTRHIARFWGIAAPAARRATAGGTAEAAKERASAGPLNHAMGKVEKVITDALRAAGLMR